MTANQTIDRATPATSEEQMIGLAKHLRGRLPADVLADSDAVANVALALKRARLLCGRFLRAAAAHDHEGSEGQRKSIAGMAYTLELLISDLDAKMVIPPWYARKCDLIERAAEEAGDGF